jgi:hypothetical protein
VHLALLVGRVTDVNGACDVGAVAVPDAAEVEHHQCMFRELRGDVGLASSVIRAVCGASM